MDNFHVIYQDLQDLGMHYENPKHAFSKLLAWLKTPVNLFHKKNKYLLIGLVSTVLSIAAISYFMFSLTMFLLDKAQFDLKSIIFLLIILIINGRILRQIRPISENIIEHTQNNVKILSGYEHRDQKDRKKGFYLKITQ